MTKALSASDRPKRRRMDIFDPSEDGIKGHTLAATIRTTERALQALDALDDALLGCMTPLSFRQTAEQVRGMRIDLVDELDVLRQAQEIIEKDLPILHLVSENPDQKPENRTLDPRRLIEINNLALTMKNVMTSTYREWAGDAAVPQLVRHTRIRRAAAAKAVAKEQVAATAEQEARQAAVNAKRAAWRRARLDGKTATAGAEATATKTST
ncbi:UNVERIFIED_ORG: hypothetical protein ABIB21_003110 [Arthrobacter sp. UYEF13]